MTEYPEKTMLLSTFWVIQYLKGQIQVSFPIILLLIDFPAKIKLSTENFMEEF